MITPQISIIIPVYNAEHYLNRCLDSILMQSFSNFEVLLIDDGSNDFSGKICDEYAIKDTRVRVFHKSNGGASSARNVGLENACGEWVTFVDSDDYIDDDYFHLKQLDEVTLAIQKWRFLSESDTREPLTEGVFFQDEFVNFMEHTIHKDVLRMVAAKFLRRDIIERHHIRFDTSIFLGEDTIFMLEYYRYIDSVSVNNSSCYVYYRPDNWSQSKYELSKSQVRYYMQQFARVYSTLNIKSDKLIQFLFGFFVRRVKNGTSFHTQLYLKSTPEYLFLNKNRMLSKGGMSYVKYLVLRAISFLR